MSIKKILVGLLTASLMITLTSCSGTTKTTSNKENDSENTDL